MGELNKRPANETSPSVDAEELQSVLDEHAEAIKPEPHIDLSYVYCSHIPENTERIAAAIGDADIVAVEYTGASAEKRERLENKANRISGNKRGVGLPAKGTEFNKALFAELKNTNKQVVLIDIADSDVEATELLNQWWFESLKLDGMWLEAPYHELVNQIRTTCELCASADIAREKIIKEQIIELIKQQDSDTKIAIVEGAIHSGTSYTVPDIKGFSITRERNWVPAPDDVDALEDSEKFRFKGQAEIVRRMMNFPEKPVTNAELKGIVLDIYFTLFTKLQQNRKSPDKFLLEPGHEDELLAKIDDIVTDPLNDFSQKAVKIINTFAASQYLRRTISK